MVYDLTSSATAVGVVSVMQFGAQFFLAPWSGALSDRFDRRRILLGGQAVQLVATGTLTVWVAITGVQGLPGPWPVYLTTLIAGLGAAVSSPAGQALVPALVPAADLDQAVALNTAPYTIARAVAPAVAAGLMLTAGPVAAFAVNTASYAVYIIGIALVRPRPTAVSARRDRSVRGGIRYVRRDRRVLTLLLGIAAVAFAADPVITLTPSLVASLGANEAAVGVLASAFGIGAAGTILIVRSVRERVGAHRVSVGGLVVLAVGILGMAAAPTLPVAAAALVVAGVGFFAANATLAAEVQSRVPDFLRGRVMALWTMAFLGSRPLAALLNGFVADRTNARAATAMAAAVAAAGAVLIRRADGPAEVARSTEVVSAEQDR